MEEGEDAIGVLLWAQEAFDGSAERPWAGGFWDDGKMSFCSMKVPTGATMAAAAARQRAEASRSTATTREKLLAWLMGELGRPADRGPVP